MQNLTLYPRSDYPSYCVKIYVLFCTLRLCNAFSMDIISAEIYLERTIGAQWLRPGIEFVGIVKLSIWFSESVSSVSCFVFMFLNKDICFTVACLLKQLLRVHSFMRSSSPNVPDCPPAYYYQTHSSVNLLPVASSLWYRLCFSEKPFTKQKHVFRWKGS